MISRKQSPLTEYEILKSIWYAKLQASGFNDLEKGDYLINWDSSHFQTKYTPECFEIKQDYYRMCELFLNQHGFDSRLELEIWRLHSDGVVPKKISKIIYELGLKANKDTIYKIINKLEEVMKLGLSFGEE